MSVTVFDDGRVIYRVDTSETDSAIFDDEDCGYTVETLNKDSKIIGADSARRFRGSYPEWPQMP